MPVLKGVKESPRPLSPTFVADSSGSGSDIDRTSTQESDKTPKAYNIPTTAGSSGELEGSIDDASTPSSHSSLSSRISIIIPDDDDESEGFPASESRDITERHNPSPSGSSAPLELPPPSRSPPATLPPLLLLDAAPSVEPSPQRSSPSPAALSSLPPFTPKQPVLPPLEEVDEEDKEDPLLTPASSRIKAFDFPMSLSCPSSQDGASALAGSLSGTQTSHRDDGGDGDGVTLDRAKSLATAPRQTAPGSPPVTSEDSLSSLDAQVALVLAELNAVAQQPSRTATSLPASPRTTTAVDAPSLQSRPVSASASVEDIADDRESGSGADESSTLATLASRSQSGQGATTTGPTVPGDIPPSSHEIDLGPRGSRGASPQRDLRGPVAKQPVPAAGSPAGSPMKVSASHASIVAAGLLPAEEAFTAGTTSVTRTTGTAVAAEAIEAVGGASSMDSKAGAGAASPAVTPTPPARTGAAWMLTEDVLGLGAALTLSDRHGPSPGKGPSLPLQPPMGTLSLRSPSGSATTSPRPAARTPLAPPAPPVPVSPLSYSPSAAGVFAPLAHGLTQQYRGYSELGTSPRGSLSARVSRPPTLLPVIEETLSDLASTASTTSTASRSAALSTSAPTSAASDSRDTLPQSSPSAASSRSRPATSARNSGAPSLSGTSTPSTPAASSTASSSAAGSTRPSSATAAHAQGFPPFFSAHAAHMGRPARAPSPPPEDALVFFDADQATDGSADTASIASVHSAPSHLHYMRPQLSALSSRPSSPALTALTALTVSDAPGDLSLAVGSSSSRPPRSTGAPSLHGSFHGSFQPAASSSASTPASTPSRTRTHFTRSPPAPSGPPSWSAGVAVDDMGTPYAAHVDVLQPFGLRAGPRAQSLINGLDMDHMDHASDAGSAAGSVVSASALSGTHSLRHSQRHQRPRADYDRIGLPPTATSASSSRPPSARSHSHSRHSRMPSAASAASSRSASPALTASTPRDRVAALLMQARALQAQLSDAVRAAGGEITAESAGQSRDSIAVSIGGDVADARPSSSGRFSAHSLLGGLVSVHDGVDTPATLAARTEGSISRVWDPLPHSARQAPSWSRTPPIPPLPLHNISAAGDARSWPGPQGQPAPSQQPLLGPSGTAPRVHSTLSPPTLDLHLDMQTPTPAALASPEASPTWHPPPSSEAPPARSTREVLSLVTLPPRTRDSAAESTQAAAVTGVADNTDGRLERQYLIFARDCTLAPRNLTAVLTRATELHTHASARAALPVAAPAPTEPDPLARCDRCRVQTARCKLREDVTLPPPTALARVRLQAPPRNALDLTARSGRDHADAESARAAAAIPDWTELDAPLPGVLAAFAALEASPPDSRAEPPTPAHWCCPSCGGALCEGCDAALHPEPAHRDDEDEDEDEEPDPDVRNLSAHRREAPPPILALHWAGADALGPAVLRRGVYVGFAGVGPGHLAECSAAALTELPQTREHRARSDSNALQLYVSAHTAPVFVLPLVQLLGLPVRPYAPPFALSRGLRAAAAAQAVYDVRRGRLPVGSTAGDAGAADGGSEVAIPAALQLCQLLAAGAWEREFREQLLGYLATQDTRLRGAERTVHVLRASYAPDSLAALAAPATLPCAPRAATLSLRALVPTDGARVEAPRYAQGALSYTVPTRVFHPHALRLLPPPAPHTPLFCRHHPSALLWSYCVACETPLCRYCTSSHAPPAHCAMSLHALAALRLSVAWALMQCVLRQAFVDVWRWLAHTRRLHALASAATDAAHTHAHATTVPGVPTPAEAEHAATATLGFLSALAGQLAALSSTLAADWPRLWEAEAMATIAAHDTNMRMMDACRARIRRLTGVSPCASAATTPVPAPTAAATAAAEVVDQACQPETAPHTACAHGACAWVKVVTPAPCVLPPPPPPPVALTSFGVSQALRAVTTAPAVVADVVAALWQHRWPWLTWPLPEVIALGSACPQGAGAPTSPHRPQFPARTAPPSTSPGPAVARAVSSGAPVTPPVSAPTPPPGADSPRSLREHEHERDREQSRKLMSRVRRKERRSRASSSRAAHGPASPHEASARAPLQHTCGRDGKATHSSQSAHAAAELTVGDTRLCVRAPTVTITVGTDTRSVPSHHTATRSEPPVERVERVPAKVTALLDELERSKDMRVPSGDVPHNKSSALVYNHNCAAEGRSYANPSTHGLHASPGVISSIGGCSHSRVHTCATAGRYSHTSCASSDTASRAPIGHNSVSPGWSGITSHRTSTIGRTANSKCCSNAYATHGDRPVSRADQYWKRFAELTKHVVNN